MTTRDDLVSLLARHQAMIDAWYANWLRRERERIEAVMAKRRCSS